MSLLTGRIGKKNNKTKQQQTYQNHNHLQHYHLQQQLEQLPRDETLPEIVRGLSKKEISRKFVNEESSTECCS